MRLFNVLMALIERVAAGDQYLQIGPILIQWGGVSVTTQASSQAGKWYANQQLTYPKAFSSAPYVFLTDNMGGCYVSSNGFSSSSTTGGLISHIDERAAQTAVYIYWLAIGKA